MTTPESKSEPEPDAPLLAMRGVRKTFPGVVALDDVSFDLRPKEVHALVGENGAGKSTLMKILGGVYPPNVGEIFIDGRAQCFRSPRDAARCGVALIHQELSLIPEMTVAANLYLGREPLTPWKTIDRRELSARARELLARLDLGLGPDLGPETPVRALGLGARQEIEILKALSLEARILVMDEPTSALTQGEVRRLFEIILQLKGEGVSIVYISHRMDEIFELADRVTVLRDGAHVLTDARDNLDPQAVIHAMVGREVDSFHRRHHRDSAHAPGEIALEVSGASLPSGVAAGGACLVDISFAVRRGEVLGLAGLLGAGRTALLEALFGVYPHAFTGQLRVAGVNVQLSSPHDALRAGLALVTEDRARLGLIPTTSVAHNISLASLEQDQVRMFISRSRENLRVDKVIDKLGIRTPTRSFPATCLSGGNQQKSMLARWWLTKPKVLFLDEPTRGVDVAAKAEIYEHIDSLAEDGLALVVVSSELPELLALADRILVMCEGRLTAEFPGREATQEKIMRAATPGVIS